MRDCFHAAIFTSGMFAIIFEYYCIGTKSSKGA